MILASMIIGGLVLGTLIHFWKDMVTFLKKAIDKTIQICRGIFYGARVFIKKMGEAYKEIAKNYSKTSMGKWEETIITRTVPESEVPKEIREKAMSKEIDITNELERQCIVTGKQIGRAHV